MPASRDASRALVDRLVDAYNAKDPDTHASLFADEARYWSALSGWLEGRDTVSAHVRELFAALPDEQMEVVRRATDGESLVMEVVSRGTDGAGQPYEIGFTEVIEVRDERIVEARVYLDPREVEGIEGHA